MIKDLSENAKQALTRAREFAKEIGDTCVSTGHLIYGLTMDHLSLGNHIFNDINIYPEMFRDHLEKLPRETAEPNKDGLHPLAAEVVTRARKVRQKLGGGRETTTDHMLIALLSIEEGSAYECIREFSVEPSEIIVELVEAMGFEMADCPSW